MMLRNWDDCVGKGESAVHVIKKSRRGEGTLRGQKCYNYVNGKVER